MKKLIIFIILITLIPINLFAASVMLKWDANDPTPEGYKAYVREAGTAYDYFNPAWIGVVTACTIDNLIAGTTYYFVVRAFEGDLESADSEEVSWTPATSEDHQTFDISKRPNNAKVN